MKKIETSKKLLWISGSVYTLTIIIGIIFVYKEIDTSFFMYAIPSAGSVYGATVAFYLNKAKMENLFKGREAFLRYKMELDKDNSSEVKDEVKEIDDELKQAIGNEVQTVLDEKFDVNQ